MEQSVEQGSERTAPSWAFVVLPAQEMQRAQPVWHAAGHGKWSIISAPWGGLQVCITLNFDRAMEHVARDESNVRMCVLVGAKSGWRGYHFQNAGVVLEPQAVTHNGRLRGRPHTHLRIVVRTE
ncbi:hypothetical protein PV05_08542 [Exophiala xenobiotica]|jgi:hypothetical protein|uniref:Uncharacterized protein n=1 Tax=Exophiala xenobiotica TaxID=348802 RepID=A0A0D2EYV4_9EURO|nr:uncharacterized protein PV05_08542 [Exophiala xenobiotica]KIW52934.1 hypothetical protein PV05_08542 [Exophiala xenobiotica]